MTQLTQMCYVLPKSKFHFTCLEDTGYKCDKSIKQHPCTLSYISDFIYINKLINFARAIYDIYVQRQLGPANSRVDWKIPAACPFGWTERATR